MHALFRRSMIFIAGVAIGAWGTVILFDATHVLRDNPSVVPGHATMKVIRDADRKMRGVGK